MISRTIFSGIQPSANSPTLGNYLGALRVWSELDKKETSNKFFSIVDLHALSTLPRPNFLRDNIISTSATILALCPSSTVYIQSEVPQHCQLSWLLCCHSSFGALNRMTQWKSKREQQHSFGLLSYPILQAADILLFRATHVPVGEDQRQHLEFTRDIAAVCNKFYKNEKLFIIPEPLYSSRGYRIMSLTCPTVKMSKSDSNKLSRIHIDDSADDIKKKIKKALTDSEPNIFFDRVHRPGVSNLIEICSAISGKDIEDVVNNCKSIQDLKELVTSLIISDLSSIKTEIDDLKRNPDYLEKKLKEGREVAESVASKNYQLYAKTFGLT
jgi:tryptophanyl-tRNA synthetase